jgi:hypothetical protein
LNEIYFRIGLKLTKKLRAAQNAPAEAEKSCIVSINQKINSS